jgi:predicted O-methyltransferase YrrM
MNYSVDWFSRHIPTWEKVLGEFKGKPITAIELGSYEGRSAAWLLGNILTHPESHLTCVDSWKDGVFFAEEGKRDIDWAQVREKFNANTAAFKNLTVFEGRTTEFFAGRKTPADLIYVDADHTAAACLTDAVLSHLLLKPGGIIIFDDYLWAGMTHAPNVPKAAIDAFMECYSEQYDLLASGYQIILKKKNAENQTQKK